MSDQYDGGPGAMNDEAFISAFKLAHLKQIEKNLSRLLLKRIYIDIEDSNFKLPLEVTDAGGCVIMDNGLNCDDPPGQIAEEVFFAMLKACLKTGLLQVRCLLSQEFPLDR